MCLVLRERAPPYPIGCKDIFSRIRFCLVSKEMQFNHTNRHHAGGGDGNTSRGRPDCASKLVESKLFRKMGKVAQKLQNTGNGAPRI